VFEEEEKLKNKNLFKVLCIGAGIREGVLHT
jgi:hypothetical protein